jgi:hypothetical protein
LPKNKDTRGKDPTFAALQTVHEALRRLRADQRGKVLTSVTTLLEIAAEPIVPSERIPEQQHTPQPPRAAAARPTGLSELMKERKPATNAGKITLFAYYREKHEGHSRFSRDDLEAYFSKAHETPPSLYNRDFVSAVRKGWLHEDGADSYITSKGIEEVESGFPNERKWSMKAAKKPKKASRVKGGPKKKKA